MNEVSRGKPLLTLRTLRARALKVVGSPRGGDQKRKENTQKTKTKYKKKTKKNDKIHKNFKKRKTKIELIIQKLEGKDGGKKPH